jgi:hypothetical protein
MIASLYHRLEVAKASQNQTLIQLLEQEQRQLEAQFAPSSPLELLLDWFSKLRSALGKLCFGTQGIQIREFSNGYDYWWYACDFEAGRCFYADSKAELAVWLQEHPRR